MQSVAEATSLKEKRMANRETWARDTPAQLRRYEVAGRVIALLEVTEASHRMLCRMSRRDPRVEDAKKKLEEDIQKGHTVYEKLENAAAADVDLINAIFALLHVSD
jgi:hypothetical protein